MYATVADLANRVGWDVLSDLARGDIDPEGQNEPYQKVVAAITAAGNLVDSYLAPRYRVPLSPVPDVVRDKVVDISLYQLASWRGLNTDEQGQLLVTNYRSAERWLQDVAKGVVALGGAPAPPQPGTIQIGSNERIFSRDHLKGW